MADDRFVRGRPDARPCVVPLGWRGEHPPLQQAGHAKASKHQQNPRVTLHLDGNGRGGDIVVCQGRAGVSDDPPAHEVPEYVEKYAAFVERNGWTPASFAADYSVPVRITIARLRGH